MSRAVVLMAPGKVNLTLEVLGPRADGYHDLASIFATVTCGSCSRRSSRELDVRIATGGPPPGEDLRRELFARSRCEFAPALAHARAPAIPSSGTRWRIERRRAVLRALPRCGALDGVDLCRRPRASDRRAVLSERRAYALVQGAARSLRLCRPTEPLWIALVHFPIPLPRRVFGAQRANRRPLNSKALAKAYVIAIYVRRHANSSTHLLTRGAIVPAIATREDRSGMGIDLALSASVLAFAWKNRPPRYKSREDCVARLRRVFCASVSAP